MQNQVVLKAAPKHGWTGTDPPAVCKPYIPPRSSPLIVRKHRRSTRKCYGSEKVPHIALLGFANLPIILKNVLPEPPSGTTPLASRSRRRFFPIFPSVRCRKLAVPYAVVCITRKLRSRDTDSSPKPSDGSRSDPRIGTHLYYYYSIIIMNL